jgi:tRNA1(Val) A37 N6-methylase TrmN6
MSWPPDQRPLDAASLTDDAFLGGRLRLLQPRKGFRAGLDGVILAAAVPARARQRICDLGCGAGTAGLCLAARVAGLEITGVENDAGMRALAIRNAERNGFAGNFEVVDCDLAGRARNLPRQHFHHVLTNPPFHDQARGTKSPQAAKAAAKSIASDALHHWLRIARAVTRPSGTVTAILPPAQLSTALAALSPQGRGVTVIPLWPSASASAKRILVRVQTNSASPLVIARGMILHGPDGKPTAQAEEILRQGGSLST